MHAVSPLLPPVTQLQPALLLLRPPKVVQETAAAVVLPLQGKGSANMLHMQPLLFPKTWLAGVQALERHN